MGALVAIAAIVGVVLAAELGRSLVARLFRYPPERVPFVKLMKLPGMRGTTGFRLTLILAGPITAYLAIAGLAFGYYGCYGFASPEAATTVASVEGGATGKLAANDKIIEVDGRTFSGGAADLSRRVNEKRGAAIELTVERGGKRTQVTVRPKKSQGRWLLGVRLVPEVDKDSGRAFKSALVYPIEQTTTVLRDFVAIFKGQDEAVAGGPVRIVAEFQSAYDDSARASVGLAMMLAVYVLLALLLVDIGRSLFLLLFRS